MDHGLIYRLIETDNGEGKIELKIFVPRTEERQRPIFLLIHGGGWSIGSHSVEEPLSQMVCGLGMIVVGVDYRLWGKPVSKQLSSSKLTIVIAPRSIRIQFHLMIA